MVMPAGCTRYVCVKVFCLTRLHTLRLRNAPLLQYVWYRSIWNRPITIWTSLNVHLKKLQNMRYPCVVVTFVSEVLLEKLKGKHQRWNYTEEDKRPVVMPYFCATKRPIVVHKVAHNRKELGTDTKTLTLCFFAAMCCWRPISYNTAHCLLQHVADN